MAFPSLLVWVSSGAAVAYVYYGIMRLPRGFIRLTASLPLMAFYVYMAPRFETIFERGNYSFFFIWLTSFKILLLCWDDGPAADPWAVASFPRFLAVMTLSLQIKRESFSERSRRQVVYTRDVIKKPSSAEHGESPDMVAIAHDRKSSAAATKRTSVSHSDVVTGANGHEARVAEPADQLAAPTQQDARNAVGLPPPDWKAWVKWVDASQEWHMVVLRLLFKLMVLMLLTSSWNLLVSNLLRVSVYDRVLRFLFRNDERGRNSALLQSRKALTDGQSSNEPALMIQSKASFGSLEQSKGNTKTAAVYALNPPLWARCIAMFSCFLVSGLMHELIFHNMSRSKPTWVAMIFFTLNGAATILEVAVRRKTRLRFPKYISTPLTLTFVFVTAIRFFYPAIIDKAGTDDKIIAEFQYFFHSLRQAVKFK